MMAPKPMLTTLAISWVVTITWSLIVIYRCRNRHSKTTNELPDLETAYLLGGEIRAKEIAFFNLVRDGWLSNDGKGLFSARFEDATAQIPDLERDMLKTIARYEAMTAQDALHIKSSATETIDRVLCEKGLLIPPSRFTTARLIAFVPPYLVSILAAAPGIYFWLSHHVSLISPVFTVATFAINQLMFNGFKRATKQGIDLSEKIRWEIQQQSGKKDTDHLATMKDRILLNGFKSVLGTAFSPTNTPDSTLKKRSSGFGYAHTLADDKSVFKTDNDDSGTDKKP